MTQSELDAAIAEVTGDDLREIRRRGFSLLTPGCDDFDTEPSDIPPQVIDWDEADGPAIIALPTLLRQVA